MEWVGVWRDLNAIFSGLALILVGRRYVQYRIDWTFQEREALRGTMVLLLGAVVGSLWSVYKSFPFSFGMIFVAIGSLHLVQFGLRPQSRFTDTKILINAFEHLNEAAIYSMDQNGKIKTWSDGAERLKGYTAEEVIGKSFRMFYTPDDQAANVPEQLLMRVEEEGFVEVQGIRVRKNGQRFLADLSLSAQYDEHGRMRSIIKVAEEVE